MGRAEDLFDRIQKGGLVAIDTLITDRVSEELFLEFKRSADGGNGVRLHERDRANLKKTIGGFANSEGGVLIWGVECSKMVDEGDVAACRTPLTNPSRFVSWLEGAISGCTVPPVVGVRSVSIPIDELSGFVATYVPKSDYAPHQQVGEGKYIIRAGSDFVPAPHGVVAGLFGRPPHPIVFASFILNPFSYYSGGAGIDASFDILLGNGGQTVAEDLFVSLFAAGPHEKSRGVYFSGKSDWPFTSGVGIDISWICPREYRLAPGAMVPIASVHLRLKKPITTDFHVQLTTGCRGAIPDRCNFVVSKEILETTLDEILVAKSAGNSSFDLTAAAHTLFNLPRS